MEWTEKLATGISSIGSQHKELFKRINNLVIAIFPQLRTRWWWTGSSIIS
jgi:hemerythrin